MSFLYDAFSEIEEVLCPWKISIYNYILNAFEKSVKAIC